MMDGRIFKKISRFFALPKDEDENVKELWQWPEEEEDGSTHRVEEVDHRIQTVADWNEKEVKRRNELLDELKGAENSEDTEESGDSEKPAEDEYRDGAVEIIVQQDSMGALIMMMPPAGGGHDVTMEQVREALQEKNIVFGINEDKIRHVLEEKLYNQEFMIAEGKEPVSGRDGQIKDYFPRKAELKYASKENGDIDYKNLNLIHNVKAGQVVCEIVRPTLPQDGMDICGRTVRGKLGTMPPIPQGKNVIFNEDNTKLITSCEGNLTFRSGRFLVEKIFEVSGNVDNSIGNIDFTGSVVIRGDVYEGFEVVAKGDITVMGMVEGAKLSASGSIILQKGMRGMKSGILEAGEDITAKFLENCKLYAKRDIRADYIINSEVSCGHDLVLNGRRGAFIGGKCSVHNCMTVKEVGAASNAATSVTLGMTPQLLDEIKTSGEELEVITSRLKEIQKDIEYLSSKDKHGSITEIQKERLKALNLENPVTSMKQKKMREKTAELSRQVREVGNCRLTAGRVHPGTMLYIGDGKIYFTKREDNCFFYFRDGEIRKGMH